MAYLENYIAQKAEENRKLAEEKAKILQREGRYFPAEGEKQEDGQVSGESGQSKR